MDANDLERLTQRIAKLESFNRRLSRVVVVLLMVLASAVWMGQRPTTKAQRGRKPSPPAAPKVVEAEQFILKTATGRVLATLGLTDGGPMLRLVGPAGSDRAVLALDAAGTPRLSMMRADGSQPIAVALTADGVPQVDVTAPDKSKARLTVGSEGPGIGLFDPAGIGRLLLNLGAEGPALTLAGKDKTTLAALSASDAGPALALSDPGGLQRITMIVVNQQAVFGIRDARGDVRVGLEVKAENPALGLYGPNGKPLFVKP